MSDKEYYPYPWQINYSQWQIRWLLSPLNWNLIKINQWPFCITDDALNRAGVSHHATFEMVSMIKVEVEERLNSVGPKDGYLCRGRYYDEDTDEQIARAFNVPVSRLFPFPRLISCLSVLIFGNFSFNIWGVLSVEPSSTKIIEDKCFFGKSSRSFSMCFSSLYKGITTR